MPGCFGAALAAVGAASAQSTVTISGAMVLGVGSTKIGTADSGLQIARQTGNLQFAGTEDLGGGLRAGFQLQTSIGGVATTNTDINQIKTRTILGDRAANLSLSGGFGSVSVGRGNTAVRSIFGAMGDVSRLSVITGLSASSSGAAAAADGGYVNANGGDELARVIYGDTFTNSVSYTSPTMNGFSVAVGVVPVQTVDTNVGDNATNKDTLSVTVQYAAGPFGAAYNLTDSKGGTAYKLHTIVASYDLGVAKVGLTHQSVDLATGTDPGNGTSITANIPMGAGSIGLGYGRRSAAAQTGTSFGDNVKQAFLGYRHDLSKRTHVQLVWNKLNRSGSATDLKEGHIMVGHSF